MLLMTAFVVPLTIFGQQVEEDPVTVSQRDDEAAVKEAVEAFLVALGNGELEKVKAMFLPNANIASVSRANGEPEIFTVSADAYISQRMDKPVRLFQEPVSKYTVNISQGMLAFVRADATVYYDGKASHHTQDFFILMKDKDVWKFLSGSYTTLPLE